MSACAATPTVYRRRESEADVLYEVLREHLGTFVATYDPPAQVRRGFEACLRCGILAHGFVRVRCPECREESLVAFSCKGRAFCPSCTARRPAETAAQLVDRVLPHVPLRQWVLAMPPELQMRVPSDPQLETRLLAIFTEELEELLRATAKAGPGAQGGFVTFIQHFGSGHPRERFRSGGRALLEGEVARTSLTRRVPQSRRCGRPTRLRSAASRRAR